MNIPQETYSLSAHPGGDAPRQQLTDQALARIVVVYSVTGKKQIVYRVPGRLAVVLDGVVQGQFRQSRPNVPLRDTRMNDQVKSLPMARPKASPAMTQPDRRRMRACRLERVRDQLRRHGYGTCLLLDPINTRYATGTSNMSLWTQHSLERYAFVAVDGPVVLFDNRDVESPSLCA